MNTGQIIKSKSTERFTVIPNELIKSNDLLLAEKGLLSYLLSLPADWVLYKSNLYKSLPDTKGSIDRNFKALQEKGYILSVKVVNDKGQFVGWNHVVYDIPANEKPTIGKPNIGNGEVGESAPIQKTNTIQKTNLTNTDNTNVYAHTKLIKPTVEDLHNYFTEKLNLNDFSAAAQSQLFLDHYEANGWKVGKNPMRDWQAAARTWKTNMIKFSNNGHENNSAGNITQPRGTSIDRIEALKQWGTTGIKNSDSG